MVEFLLSLPVTILGFLNFVKSYNQLCEINYCFLLVYASKWDLLFCVALQA